MNHKVDTVTYLYNILFVLPQPSSIWIYTNNNGVMKDKKKKKEQPVNSVNKHEHFQTCKKKNFFHAVSYLLYKTSMIIIHVQVSISLRVHNRCTVIYYVKQTRLSNLSK